MICMYSTCTCTVNRHHKNMLSYYVRIGDYTLTYAILWDAMRCVSNCGVLTYTASVSQSLFKSYTDLGPSRSTNQSHLSSHESFLLSAQQIKKIWLLSLSVAHMDGAVGSEGTAGIWSRHPDCIYCCNIKSATYRMQPCNPPSAYKHEGDFENVLAYSTAHELNSKPILLEPWRHIQTGAGAIKNSGSRSTFE